jgi:hypothetical protein
MEDTGYAVMLEYGNVLIQLKGVSLDEVVRFGIKKGMMYMVLGQHVVGSKGILDHRLVSMVESRG